MVDPKLQVKGRSVEVESVRWVVTILASGKYETLEIHEHPVGYLKKHRHKVLVFALELGSEVPGDEWEGSGTKAVHTRTQEANRGGG